MSCHSKSHKTKKTQNNGGITIALAGNANVGKSVLFNQLTGSSQIIGNWPGKTVEKAEGTLTFEGQKIKVIDAAVLERNLFFTLQLIEMNAPLVICLNQFDVAKSKGITINTKKLEQALGAPVIPTVAIRGEGIYELTKAAVTLAKNCDNKKTLIRYGAEVEERIDKLDETIQAANLELKYPSRWVAIKLLENDSEITKLVNSNSQTIIEESRVLASEISAIHNEPCFAVIASERYSLASKFSSEDQQQSEKK